MHHLLLWLSHSFQALSLPARAPIAISLGAIAGALSRYYLTLGLTQWLGPAFPYGTLTINLSGSFAMGFFTTFVAQVITSPDLHLFISVGFLGAYTTFSTYALDTVNLLDSGRGERALFYWAGSAFLGVVGLEIGRLLARRLL